MSWYREEACKYKGETCSMLAPSGALSPASLSLSLFCLSLSLSLWSRTMRCTLEQVAQAHVRTVACFSRHSQLSRPFLLYSLSSSIHFRGMKKPPPQKKTKKTPKTSHPLWHTYLSFGVFFQNHLVPLHRSQSQVYPETLS